LSIPIAVGIYFICWWLVLFTLLPIGIRMHEDADERPEGTADSAPVQPYILRKFAAATLISAVVFAIVYAVIVYHLIPFERFPTSL
jgi:predicted secreted protein